MSFFGELRRRNVVKVAVAYAIVGWLLIEVSSVLLPAFEAPDWVLRVIVLLIVIGFVLALVLSWAYEITPEGMKKSHEVEATESITHVTGRKIDFAIIGALVLALGFVVYNYVLVEEDAVPETVADESIEVPPPVLVEERPEVIPNSVAVLLCDNLSPDPDDAYFAAGIHEEILNQLVKLRNLNVIARTSVLQYADAPPPIPQIAEELNVGAVVECSVRFAGNAIMVTAQLIDPETNSHMWSDTYPGDLSNLSTVFAMQADIAMNIANAVGAEFSLEEQQSIEKIPTESPAAYQFYLAALDASGDLRTELVTQAIFADPDFAAAYVLRARSYLGSLQTLPIGESGVAEREGLALRELDRALELDPNLALGHLLDAQIHAWNWRGREAREAFERAYQLSPNDPGVLAQYARFMSYAGPQEDAIELFLRELQLGPGSSRFFLAHAYELMGDLDAAANGYRERLERAPRDSRALTHLVQVELRRGNTVEAENLLPLAERVAMSGASAVLLPQIGYAYVQLGRDNDATRVLDEFDRRAASSRQAGVSWVTLHLARGEEGQALEWLSRAAERVPYEGYNLVYRVKNNVFESPILDQPEFLELREQLGFTDL